MKKSQIINSILCIIFACIFVFSAYKIVIYFKVQKEAKDTYTNYQNLAVSSDADTNQDTSEEQTEPKISVNFDSLLKECKDIVGWIYSPDTVINYPVVKGADNNQYLHRLPNGKNNIAGSIFADYRNFSFNTDSNYLIYGHHMKNDSMFGTLLNYKSQSYYDAHPIIYFLTPEKNYKIKLYSGFVTPADSDAYIINRTEEEMAEFMDKISRKSTFKTNAKYKAGDKIVTLSTCTNVSDDQRYVVIGIIEEIV